MLVFDISSTCDLLTLWQPCSMCHRCALVKVTSPPEWPTCLAVSNGATHTGHAVCLVISGLTWPPSWSKSWHRCRICWPSTLPTTAWLTHSVTATSSLSTRQPAHWSLPAPWSLRWEILSYVHFVFKHKTLQFSSCFLQSKLKSPKMVSKPVCQYIQFLKVYDKCLW